MRKAESKVISLEILKGGIERLAKLVEHASTFDARLVRIAASGFQNARRWTSDTTVTNQTRTARYARAVIQTAQAEILPTRTTRAILAYGHALQQFAACEYNAANLYTQTALDLLNG